MLQERYLVVKTGKIVSIFLVLSMMLLISTVHAKECNEKLRPSINISDKEDLFEDQSYYRKIVDQKLGYISYVEINSSMKNFRLDKKTLEINFTPAIADIGTHKLFFIAIDDMECYASKLVTFTIYDRPRITPIKPETKFVSMSEGQGMVFAADIQDLDNDIREYNWYINGVNQKGSLKDRFPFTTNYNDTGVYELMFEVIDSKKLNDSFTWIISVKEKNRDPYLYAEMPDYAAPKSDAIRLDALNNHFGDADNDTLHYVINATDADGNAIDVSSYVNEKGEIVLNASENTGVIIIEITAKDLFGGVIKSNKFKVFLIDKQDAFGYKQKPTHVCGDLICGGNETCQSCFSDCGPCIEDETRCEGDWLCTDWSACLPYGFMVRQCEDRRECFDQFSTKPNIALTCDMKESCFDNLKNNGERNVDCGGPCDACPTCSDKRQNGGEAGVDCGGPCDVPCPTCSDEIQNQFESDVDCGGPCVECDDTFKCYSWKDCKSHICKNGFCAVATCIDGVKNQNEKGVDCEGVCEVTCPSCSDEIQNHNETGIDCGGPCDACPTCDDNKKNQDERFIDCGGESCESCAWSDFKRYSPGKAIAMQIILIIILLPFLMLMAYEFFKKYIGRSDIEKLIFINEMLRGKKKRFAEHKAEINDAIGRIKKLQKEMGEASKKNSREEISEIISELLDKLIGIALTNDETTVKRKLKERKIAYPLNRIMIYIFKETREISTNKYLSGLEFLNRLETLTIALLELEKET